MIDTNHTTQLTDLQLAVVRALWTQGECMVLDVQQALLPERPLAQTTVATLLTRLEKRAVVSHRVEGRQFVYRALVTEPQVKVSMVGQLTEMLFAGYALGSLVLDRSGRFLDMSADLDEDVEWLMAPVLPRAALVLL